MSFTLVQQQPSGPREYALNSMLSNALEGYKQGKNLKYMDREKEAGIFNKTVSPLAQIAISPYAALLGPEGQERLKQMLSQGMQNVSSQGQQQQGGGFHPIQAIMHALHMGNQSQQGGQQGEQQQMGGQKQGQGEPDRFGSDVQRQVREPRTQTGIVPGKTIVDENGNPVSSPANAATINEAQDILTATQEIAPLIEDVIEQSKPFEGSLKSMGQLGLSRLGIKDRDLANQYADLQDTQNNLKKIYRKQGATEQEAEQAVRFQQGETAKHYGDRQRKAYMRYVERAKRAQSRVGKGFSLDTDEPVKSIDQKIARDEKERKTANAVSNKMKYSQMSDEELTKLYRGLKNGR